MTTDHVSFLEATEVLYSNLNGLPRMFRAELFVSHRMCRRKQITALKFKDFEKPPQNPCNPYAVTSERTAIKNINVREAKTKAQFKK